MDDSRKILKLGGTGICVHPGELCTECGAHCCRYGGAVATREEHAAIVAAGYHDCFQEVSERVQITEWGLDGDCPYLVDNVCSIYEVRPLRCRAYPVFQVNTGEVFLSLCPLSQYLSSEEVADFANLLSQCPRSFLEDASRYLEAHSKELEMRLSRFRIRKIR